MKNWTPEEIKELRLKRGTIQKTFAELLGVTREYICYLEKGVRTPSNIMKRLLDCVEEKENGREKKEHGNKRHL